MIRDAVAQTGVPAPNLVASGDLTIGDDANIGDDAHVSGDLDVDGDANVDGALTVDGPITAPSIFGLKFRVIAETTWVAGSPTVTTFGPYTLAADEYPMVLAFRTDAVANGGFGPGKPDVMFESDDCFHHYVTTSTANQFSVKVGHVVAGNANANFRVLILGVSTP